MSTPYCEGPSSKEFHSLKKNSLVKSDKAPGINRAKANNKGKKKII
jgi:hypothetical protein